MDLSHFLKCPAADSFYCKIAGIDGKSMGSREAVHASAMERKSHRTKRKKQRGLRNLTDCGRTLKSKGRSVPRERWLLPACVDGDSGAGGSRDEEGRSRGT